MNPAVRSLTLRRPAAPQLSARLTSSSTNSPRKDYSHAFERPKKEPPRRTRRNVRGDGRRGRIDDAQAGPDVLDPEDPGRQRRRDHGGGDHRGAERRLWFPPL